MSDTYLVYADKPVPLPTLDVRAGPHEGLGKWCQAIDRTYHFPHYLLHLFEVIIKLGPFSPSDLLTDQLGNKRR